MPMFQVDRGRAVVVQPVRPSADAFAETSGVLVGNLDALLGEQLLPVRVGSGDDDEPYLLALDGSGQPVVVEVTALLDETAVIRALRHTGRVARMSPEDLAALHPAGAERLAEDLTRFRQSTPFALLGRPVGGVRLLLVCSEIADGMAEAVEALTAPGRGVDVLRVGVVQQPGRPLVDISPVRPSPTGPSRHSAPAAAAETPAAPAPAARTPAAPAPTAAPGTQDAPTSPRGIPVVAAHAVPGTDAHAVPLVDAHAIPVRVPSGLRPAAPGYVPVSGPPPRPDGSRPLAAEPLVLADGPPPGFPDAGDGASRHVRTAAERRPSSFGPDARLVALARSAGGTLALVWWRRRRDERHEVLLREDGSIELADGTRVTDPSAAAEIASGSHAPVDGWQVWRVGEQDGPTLAEAVGVDPQPHP